MDSRPNNDPLGGVIDVRGDFGLVQALSFADRFPVAIRDALVGVGRLPDDFSGLEEIKLHREIARRPPRKAFTCNSLPIEARVTVSPIRNAVKSSATNHKRSGSSIWSACNPRPEPGCGWTR